MAVKHARPLLELAPNSQLSCKMFLSEICFNLPIISISASLLLRRFVLRIAEASAKRVTGDEPQGTMGRVQFPPSFARTFSSKERRLGTRQYQCLLYSGI